MAVVLLVSCLLAFPSSSALSHWIVTEDGKIQTPSDSLFTMRKAHDLVQFMRQEERVKEYHETQGDIDEHKTTIAEKEKSDDPELEERLMRTDADCVFAEKPLAQHDLHSHYAVSMETQGRPTETFLGRPQNFERRQQPHCEEFLHLPFSPYAFEHLPNMRAESRTNMTIPPETTLGDKLLRGWTEPADYGHAVRLALFKKPEEWALFNMATFYWRIVGDAAEALECTRRALHLTPPAHYSTPLLNLASVLHQAGRSTDAAVVLDVLLEQFPVLGSAWCVGGEAFAVSQDLPKAALAFDVCGRLQEGGRGKERAAAVRCHLRLEAALEAQHESLQHTLSELQTYQEQLRRYQTLHEDMLRSLADPEAKLHSLLVYDHFTYGVLPGLDCSWEKDNGLQALHCDVDDMELYRRSKELKINSVPRRVPKIRKLHPSALQQHTDKIDFPAEAAFLTALEPKRGLLLPETLPRRYPLTDRTHLRPEDLVWESPQWPAECAGEAAALARLGLSAPAVFLSPGAKGFDVARLLSTELGLGAGEEHPLPWYPPFCAGLPAFPGLHLPCCDHLLGVQRAKSRERQLMLAEAGLKSIFLGLPSYPSDQEAELGMRIRTLLNYNMGPQWLVLSLATLYWRVVGLVGEAAACARLAVHASPPKYKDVALVQLAQLAVRGGDRLEDGILLLHHAVAADKLMPESQLLLGHYLLKKENFTGAAHHIRLSLELDPQVPGGVALYRALRCRLRELEADKRAPEPTDSDSKMVTAAKPILPPCARPRADFFCVWIGEGTERCYLREVAPPAEAASHCRITMAEKPRCIRAPPLAPLLIASLGPDAKRNPSAAFRRVDAREGQSFAKTTSKRKEEGSHSEVSLDHDNMREGTTEVPVAAPSARTVVYRAPPGAAPQPSATPPPPPPKEDLTTKSQEGTVPLRDKGPETPRGDLFTFADGQSNDTQLPEVLPEPYSFQVRDGARLVHSLPKSTAECKALKKRVKPEQATSTWLSVTAKGVKLDLYVNFTKELPEERLEPICPPPGPATMWTMEHLMGYQLRERHASYRPEKGLKEAFEGLGGTPQTLQDMATRLALAIRDSPDTIRDQNIVGVSGPQEDGVHWALSTVAALYWRVKGNASMAIRCLRHGLNNAPYHMRDLALISLANVYQQSGLPHSALVVASAALHLNQRFVVIHFTLANIYASMGPAYYDRAMMFYFSTLALQNNFDPARERIRALYCLSGALPPDAQNAPYTNF